MMRVDASKPALPQGAAWLFHLFYFTSTGLLAAGLGLVFQQSFVGFIVMVLLWLPSIGLMPWVWQKLTGQVVEMHGLAMLMILISWAGVSAYVDALPWWWQYPSPPEVAAQALSTHPDPLIARVRGGRVQTHYAYLHTSRHYDSRRSTTTTTLSCVAPITAHEWTPDQAIGVWAVCDTVPSTCSRCPEWTMKEADVIPVLSWGNSVPDVAAQRAAQHHGLTLGTSVRVVTWVKSAPAALHARVRTVAVFIWGFYLLWAVCVGLARGINAIGEWHDRRKPSCSV